MESWWNVEIDSKKFTKDFPKEIKAFFEIAQKTTEKQYVKYNLKDSGYVENFYVYLKSGGIHAATNNSIYNSNDSYSIINIDIDSQYPSLICNYDLFPDSFSDESRKIFKGLLKEKNENGNKSLKPLINNFYGSILQKSSKYYDLEKGRAICYLGEDIMFRYLLMLIKFKGVILINVNTDGVIFLVNKDIKDKVLDFTDKYFNQLGLQYSTKYFTKFFQKNINNYLAQEEEIKIKGDILKYGMDLSKAKIYEDCDVVKKAVINHLINNESVESYINECNDLKEFLIYRNIGESFDEVVQAVGNINISHNFSIRILASKDKKYNNIYKIKGNTNVLVNSLPPNPRVAINLTDDYNDLDKDYYINLAKKIAREYVKGENLMQLKFIPLCKDSKIPIKGFDYKKPLSYDQVLEYSDYGLIIPDDLVLVDVDNIEQGEKLVKLLKDLKVPTTIMRTPNGYHFYFKKGKYDFTNVVKQVTPIGITVDIKAGGKDCYAKIYGENENRYFLNGGSIEDMFSNLVELPNYLYPMARNKYDIYNIEQGQRNNTLFKYISELFYENFTVQNVIDTIRLLNIYILNNPLPVNEVETMIEKDKLDERYNEYHEKFSTRKIKGSNHIQDYQKNKMEKFENNLEKYCEIAKELYKLYEVISVNEPFDHKVVEENGKTEKQKVDSKAVMYFYRSYLFKHYPNLSIKDKEEIFEILDILCYNRAKNYGFI